MKKPRPPKIPLARFNLKTPNASASLVYLKFRYWYRGEQQIIVHSTSWNIDPKHWDKKTQRARHIRGKEEYLELNTALDTFQQIAQGIFIEHNYGDISPDDFRKEIEYRTGKAQRPADQKATTLFQFIENFIQQQQRRANAKRGTWKKFLTVYNHLQDFAADQGKAELSFEDIDWKFRFQFLEWLYAPPREHAINNAAKIMEVVKQFMRQAKREGLHENTTFEDAGFGVKRVKVKNKVRLTFQELASLLELDLSDNTRLERVRDLFIVGAYTGLRFSDWSKVKRDQIITEPDGTQLLEILTGKDRDHLFIPLLPELKKVLEKYSFELPEMSVQEFNRIIKEVCRLAIADSRFLRIYSEGGKVQDEMIGKWEKASSHAARRSFATNFWEMGIPASILMQITGHSTEKQFFEYIDVDKRTVARQFAREVARKMATGGHTPEGSNE